MGIPNKFCRRCGSKVQRIKQDMITSASQYVYLQCPKAEISPYNGLPTNGHDSLLDGIIPISNFDPKTGKKLVDSK